MPAWCMGDAGSIVWGMHQLKGVKWHKNFSMENESSPLVTMAINLRHLHVLVDLRMKTISLFRKLGCLI